VQPERWKQIERLFIEALDREPSRSARRFSTGLYEARPAGLTRYGVGQNADRREIITVAGLTLKGRAA
jgi:hypothetical protein